MGNDQLRALRELTGSLHIIEKQFWKAPDFPAGVAQGIVAELLGHARVEWLLALFRMNPEPFVFWCEREARVNPTAVQQRGVNLERVKFVHASGDLQQALRLALDSQLYPFVVAPGDFADGEARAYQRLHLLAEKAKSTVFLLPKQKFCSAWPIALQLQVEDGASGFAIEVRRQRHGGRE